MQRLVGNASDGGDGMTRGYAEYTGSQGPGLLCDRVLDVQSARVACASSSEQFLHSLSRVAPPNTTLNVFYRGRIECTGDEVDITECSVGVEPTDQCYQGLVQYLTCTSCKSMFSVLY